MTLAGACERPSDVLPAPVEAKGFALSREPTKEGDPVQARGPVVLFPAP